MRPGGGQILKTAVPERTADLVSALAGAARARRVSPARIGAEILRLSLGRQKLGWVGYFLYGAHQPGLSDAARAEFLGDRVMDAMNGVLSARDPALTAIVSDKLQTDLALTRHGLPVAPIRAVVLPQASPLPYPVLPDAAALERFLLSTPLPVFGKPIRGSRSIGAFSLVAREGTTLVLGDGTRTDAAGLAQEIQRLFPDGFLFQDLMVPHPDLARIVGPVIATVRVVTLQGEDGIAPLYSVMKMPGKDQMVDDIVSVVNTMCAVDLASGRILRGHDPRGLGGVAMERNPVTGSVLSGAVLPLWPDAMATACAIHGVFPGQGLMGVDLALTPSGPRLIELNAAPMHGLYQKCFARGFWNSDIAPRMTRALAGFGHVSPTRSLPFP